MSEARVVLYGPSSTYDIPPNSGENIKASYNLNQAEVTQGRWIFYDGQFNNQCKSAKLVREGEGKVDLGFICTSAREVEYKADGVSLFEHYNYCGKMEVNVKIVISSSGSIHVFNSLMLVTFRITYFLHISNRFFNFSSTQTLVRISLTFLVANAR